MAGYAIGIDLEIKNLNEFLSGLERKIDEAINKSTRKPSRAGGETDGGLQRAITELKKSKPPQEDGGGLLGSIGSRGVTKIVGLLGAIAGSVAIISNIIGNQFSGWMKATKRLLDVFVNILFKPLADVVGVLLAPFLRMMIAWYMPILKEWNQVLSEELDKGTGRVEALQTAGGAALRELGSQILSSIFNFEGAQWDVINWIKNKVINHLTFGTWPVMSYVIDEIKDNINFDTITNAWDNFVDSLDDIKTNLGDAWDKIVGEGGVLETIKENLGNSFDNIGSKLSSAKEWLHDSFKDITGDEGILGKAYNWLKTAWENITGSDGEGGVLGTACSWFTKINNKLGSIFKKLDNLLDKIPTIKIPTIKKPTIDIDTGRSSDGGGGADYEMTTPTVRRGSSSSGGGGEPEPVTLPTPVNDTPVSDLSPTPVSEGGHPGGGAPMFQTGTAFVPETGMYLLHRGEEVRSPIDRREEPREVNVNIDVNVEGSGAANIDVDDLIDKLKREIFREISIAGGVG